MALTPEEKTQLDAKIQVAKNNAEMYALPRLFRVEQALPEAVQKRVSLTPMTADPNSGQSTDAEPEVIELDEEPKSVYQSAVDKLKKEAEFARKVARGEAKINR